MLVAERPAVDAGRLTTVGGACELEQEDDQDGDEGEAKHPGAGRAAMVRRHLLRPGWDG